MILQVLTSAMMHGQARFPELVTQAYGTDQELINGIQFSNHYGRIDGNPYFMDGRFRPGAILVNDQRHEEVMLRYNLYSQKVEIEYQTLEGNLNQVMTVAEHIPAFLLDGSEFRRMQFPDELPAYYQVKSFGENRLYVGWSKVLIPTHGSSSKEYEFSLPRRSYWLQLDRQLKKFHNRRTFIKVFPAVRQKEVSKLLKQPQFSIQNASIQEMQMMLQTTLRLLETDDKP